MIYLAFAKISKTHAGVSCLWSRVWWCSADEHLTAPVARWVPCHATGCDISLVAELAQRRNLFGNRASVDASFDAPNYSAPTRARTFASQKVARAVSAERVMLAMTAQVVAQDGARPIRGPAVSSQGLQRRVPRHRDRGTERGQMSGRTGTWTLCRADSTSKA